MNFISLEFWLNSNMKPINEFCVELNENNYLVDKTENDIVMVMFPDEVRNKTDK